MLRTLCGVWADVCAGTYCAMHNISYEDYTSLKEKDLGIIGYAKKYPYRVKMMVAPLFAGLFGVAYVYKVIPMMYGLMAVWYLWSAVGDILTARHDYLMYGPKIQSWISSSILFDVWGIRTISYYAALLCVLSYSFMVTAVYTIIATTLFI